jgi:hypothetical protein
MMDQGSNQAEVSNQQAALASLEEKPIQTLVDSPLVLVGRAE